MKIIQVGESLQRGDAVSNDIIAIDAALKEMGVCGGIFISNKNNICKDYLHTIAESINKIPKLHENDILLFHHCIANPFIEHLSELICHKVLVYHNITPPMFFEGFDDGMRIACEEGLKQLSRWKHCFDCCIADSEFNKLDLLRAGYRCPIFVFPVVIPFKDYEREPNKEIVKKYSDDRSNILFVGRLSPNKKIEDVIHAFAIYKRFYEQNARLFLVGSDAIESYKEYLINYLKEINIEDVIITGSVPFPDILAYYSVSNAFVCMSEHEGFCVPLLESMLFDIPVIAYNSSAVPYTLKDSGILINKKDFPLIAGWINRIINDNILRTDILKKQRAQLAVIKNEQSKQKITNLFETIIKQFNRNVTRFDVADLGVSEEPTSFLLVMPIKASDWQTAQRCIPYITVNLKPRKIIIISSSELRNKLPNDIVFIDENNLIEGMTLNRVRTALENAGGNPRYAGWYLQQFLKLGFSRVCPDPYYLVWDADTLPLSPISFFDENSGQPVFNLKREYVEPYFSTMNNLLNLKKERPESFISEHMLIDTTICKLMLTEIETNGQVNGTAFWEKCIFASDFSHSTQAFSEYETFGTYVEAKYPNKYKTRKLQSFRPGSDFLGDSPAPEILEWVSKDFETVSFEHWSTPLPVSTSLCNDPEIRKKYSFKDIVRFVNLHLWMQAKDNVGEYYDQYIQLQKRQEFDWFFDDLSSFEKQYNV